QLAALRDQIDTITTSISSWKNAKALIAKRLPAWQILERLSLHAAGIEGAADTRKQVDAIRTHRQLLDATDPVPALRATLNDLLRQSLNNAHEAHDEAYTTGLAQLDSNDTWQRLTAPQRQKILADVDLTTPVKPDTNTDSTILAALDSRNLATRKEIGRASCRERGADS